LNDREVPKVHLIEGPVGAGKSTFALRLARETATPPLILDAWMVTLFRPDRPKDDFLAWYAERKQRCIKQIWQVACGMLETGNDAILELGLVQRQSRLRFYQRLEAAGLKYVVYLLDAPREVRHARVRSRNRERGPTFAMEVSDEIFELASGMWEPPDDTERAGRDFRLV
jgi:predicted kinase